MVNSDQLDLPSHYDISELEGCLKELILLDKDWMPKVQDPKSDHPQLYVRLCHLSTENMLGIRTSF
jgi:hypothetical protein